MKRLLPGLFFLLLVRPLLGLILGINVFGRDHLPSPGRQFILIANHNSHLDTLALLNLFPLAQLHRIHPVAAADYFMANPVLAWFSTHILNIIPIPRSGFTKTNNPITLMGKALEQGDSLIVFPEGSRGVPEEMEHFKTGVAHLILKYPDVPVIPVFMQGMGRSLPKGEFLLVPLFCDVMIGPPQFYTGAKEDICYQMERDVISLKVLLASLVGTGSDS